jgi:hypothetical protein
VDLGNGVIFAEGWPPLTVDPLFVSGQSHGFPEFQKTCEAVLMGRTTFEPAFSSARWPWPDLDVAAGAAALLGRRDAADRLAEHRYKARTGIRALADGGRRGCRLRLRMTHQTVARVKLAPFAFCPPFRVLSETVSHERCNLVVAHGRCATDVDGAFNRSRCMFARGARGRCACGVALKSCGVSRRLQGGIVDREAPCGDRGCDGAKKTADCLVSCSVCYPRAAGRYGPGVERGAETRVFQQGG